MKRPPLALSLLVALLACLGPLGCASPRQTTPLQTSGQTLASIAITVDHAMKGWGDWVKIQRANPAADQPALLRSEGRVMSAYENYQAAMRLARFAYAAATATPPTGTQAEVDAALAEVTKAQHQFTTLATQLAKP